jgi:predicted dehydrogenase
LPVLKNLEQVEIVWQYDKNEKRSALIEKMFDVKALDEADIQFAIRDIDICLLTIPYGVRKEFIEKCAALNKSMYVEKPFARTTAEHEYYCKLFSPYKLAVGFQRRFYKIVTFLQLAINGNFFGALKEIVFTEGYFNIKGGSKFLSDVNLSGGGVIIESAIHSLDQILLITSANNVEVTEVNSFHKDLLDYGHHI